jgi:hypothetical protein
MYTFNQALEMSKEQTVCTMDHPIGGSKISKEANHSFLFQRFNALTDGFMKGKYNIQIIFSIYEGLSKEDYKTFCIHHSHMKESLEILRKGTGSEEEKKDVIDLIPSQFKYSKPLYTTKKINIHMKTI